MAFMMPVVKNDWDIYNSQRTRRSSESAPEGRGRARKISESRSEGPALSPRTTRGQGPGGLGSAHRSAPSMRSSSYSRAPVSRSSRASLRAQDGACSPAAASGSPPHAPPPPARGLADKFHNRLVDKLKRALGRSADGRDSERSS